MDNLRRHGLSVVLIAVFAVLFVMSRDEDEGIQSVFAHQTRGP